MTNPQFTKEKINEQNLSKMRNLAFSASTPYALDHHLFFAKVMGKSALKKEGFEAVSSASLQITQSTFFTTGN